ncbi:TetR family transcriptional regulator [Pseudoduganella sp. FT93W]|uniref:TetR family transcriptional regulator n=1 Tax=Duganella fentianensis TaxID=2692177 RepID=A0A845HX18_9BURK|nr:TetR/AcrR family transcriptional regulator [Duganella fentianensis]MYN44125.1 TetR family transcriptional regulator [Duganella fentianensis]
MNAHDLDETDYPEEITSLPDTAPCAGKSAGRPRAADKEARQQALLQTAGRLFLDKGYGSVSLEMIAREAHVAVRTIYVKFGGKVGLFNAVIASRRAHFFEGMQSMETDMRPMEQVLSDFALRFLELLSQPKSYQLYRMVVGESRTSPELAETFYEAGPKRTRVELARYFDRPDVRAQLRSEFSSDVLAFHLLNCVLGDGMCSVLFPQESALSLEVRQARVKQGLQLFLHGVQRPAL